MGANGGETVDAERLAFEAWMRGNCWALTATWDGTTYRGTAEHGNYICPHAMQVRQLWTAGLCLGAKNGGMTWTT